MIDVLERIQRGGIRQTAGELLYQLTRHRRATRAGLQEGELLELCAELEDLGLVESELVFRLTAKGEQALDFALEADPNAADEAGAIGRPRRMARREAA